MFGLTKFDQFRESLGISPNILSRRLKQLVANGFLERLVNTGSPVRVDYVFTSKGRAFQPVLLYLNAFGSEHFAPEGPAVVVFNRETGEPADLQIVDRKAGRDVTWPEYGLAPGPAASDAMKAKLRVVEENLTRKKGATR